MSSFCKGAGDQAQVFILVQEAFFPEGAISPAPGMNYFLLFPFMALCGVDLSASFCLHSGIPSEIPSMLFISCIQ